MSSLMAVLIACAPSTSAPPADGPAGVVRLPSGEPAADATVHLILGTNPAQFEDGELKHVLGPVRNGDMPKAVTRADGRFLFPPPTDPFVLVAIHAAGYAEVPEETLTKAPDVTLTPWSRVEGTARVGSKPAAGRKVLVSGYPMRTHRNLFSTQAVADSTGRFSVERVPAGVLTIGLNYAVYYRAHGVSESDSDPHANGFTLPVETTPGKTTRIDVGGFGRPITGRVVHSDQPDGQNSSEALGRVLSLTRLRPKPPPDVRDRGRDAVREWNAQWDKSDEGREARGLPWHYTAHVKADGGFRVDDVVAGAYEIRVNSAVRLRTSDGRASVPTSYVSDVLEIREATKGGGDADLDLGDVRLRADRQDEGETQITGGPAPDFEVPSLDGKTIRLKDFRGKYVLLDFWATWCGPCRRELPGLKKLQERFGASERFALVSLSLDEDMKTLKDFVEKEKLNWTHGLLGESKKTPIPDRYGVRGIPHLFLIGPDGRIMDGKLYYDTAKQALERLVPANDPSGSPSTAEATCVVTSPAGEPAAGARVYVCLGAYPLMFQNELPGHEFVRRQVVEFKTDGDGRFTFISGRDPFTILVFHDSGYGEVSEEQFAKDATIRLLPWSRITGVARIGAEPVRDVPVRVNVQAGSGQISHSYEVSPDAEGRFVFDRVPAGGSAFVSFSDSAITDRMRVQRANSSYSLSVEVPPGETVDLNLGGFGRPVTGRLEIVGEKRSEMHWYNTMVELQRESPVPDDVRREGRAAMGAWYEKWKESPEGLAARKRPGSYRTRAGQNRSFRIDDVAEGRYRITVMGMNPDDRVQSDVIEVPPMPGGRSDEVLDVGTIRLRRMERSDSAAGG